MVARLFRLRVALLGGAFRGSGASALRTVLLFLVLAAAAVGLALAPELLLHTGAERAVVDIIIGSAVLLAVFVVPFFDHRRRMEPQQFASYPVSPGNIGFAMLVNTIVSWPFMLLLVWLGALFVLRPEWGTPAWVAPVSLVLAALFAICSVRVMSALSNIVAGPRFAGALRTFGVLLLVAILPVAVYAATTAMSDGGARSMTDTANILSLTPFGAPFAAMAAAATGDMESTQLYLGIIGGSVVLLLAIWIPLVWVSVQRIDRPISAGTARNGLGWFERFAARPASVIAARQMTYWARDPRYRVALFAIPVAPAVMLVAFSVAGADLRPLALIPLPVILLLLGWSQHNDVAMDSTAIWEHVASGIPGRVDRAGRLAPIMILGIPLAVIGSSLTVTILGEWRVLPAVIGMNIGVLLVASGITSVFSVMMPYPTTRPGDSPFVQPQWSGSGAGAAQTLSMLFSLVFAAPVVWYSVMAIVDVEFTDNIWALVFGVGYGLVILVLGILIGGKIFDRSGPELIAVTQVFD